MAWDTGAWPDTASEPPSQKSFRTSTMISARIGPTVSSGPGRCAGNEQGSGRLRESQVLESRRPLPARHPAGRPGGLRPRARGRLRRRTARGQARRTLCRVTAIDRDTWMIALARAQAQTRAAERVTFVEADFLAHPLAASTPAEQSPSP